MSQLIRAVAVAVLAVFVLGVAPSRAADPAAVKKLLSTRHCAGCDLSGADLGHQYLRLGDLTGANLIGADLTSADLQQVNLTRANLAGANLAGVDLTGATLTDADLTGANLERTDLADAQLSSATWIDGSKCDPGSRGVCMVGGVAKPLP